MLGVVEEVDIRFLAFSSQVLLLDPLFLLLFLLLFFWGCLLFRLPILFQLPIRVAVQALVEPDVKDPLHPALHFLPPVQ